MSASRLCLLSGLFLGLAVCAGCAPPPNSSSPPPPVGATTIPGGPSTGAHTGGAGSPNDKDKKPPAKNKPAAPPANAVPAGDAPPPRELDDATRKELKALEGVWVLIGAYDATDDQTSSYGHAKYTFTKGKGRCEFDDAQQNGSGTVSLDVARKPKRMDLIFDGDGGGTGRYIYELKGDHLKLCFARQKPEEYPKDLDTGANTELLPTILEFKRLK